MIDSTGISVLILTRNEEQDLPGCLDSAAFSDDIHVLDSQSTDRTREIAVARGAKVTIRPFDSYAKQRNAGLALSLAHAWVLVLDADERVTPALAAEMQQVVSNVAEDVAGFRMRRRDFLWGTWLRHAQMTPFYVRLLRVGRARYTREINEVVEVEGDIANLTAPLDHHPFSKGISHWVAKHNTYSTMEAELLAARADDSSASLRKALFAKNFHERRVAQKAIFYRLPGRPLIKWAYMMFVRGAVLDGSAGIAYATLASFYEYLIELKAKEIRRRNASLPL
ncbi:Glycosyltransferase involved in cell wall bisynthesis [Bryocella elongata]|uniref:Glycosyltransferase involved in cell wall bisynthesis n=1 Tax=Bryocella elongata TaxID=863522 RepID=A0A1H5Z6S8_9BACT|nr:glycosyltransferase family 2 protein [Bryocella elongata]SEG32031.1 Glycosyltransferase involved in cell wall bisynthesis [Bryocella elongata]